MKPIKGKDGEKTIEVMVNGSIQNLSLNKQNLAKLSKKVIYRFYIDFFYFSQRKRRRILMHWRKLNRKLLDLRKIFRTIQGMIVTNKIHWKII